MAATRWAWVVPLGMSVVCALAFTQLSPPELVDCSLGHCEEPSWADIDSAETFRHAEVLQAGIFDTPEAWLRARPRLYMPEARPENQVAPRRLTTDEHGPFLEARRRIERHAESRNARNRLVGHLHALVGMGSPGLLLLALFNGLRRREAPVHTYKHRFLFAAPQDAARRTRWVMFLAAVCALGGLLSAGALFTDAGPRPSPCLTSSCGDPSWEEVNAANFASFTPAVADLRSGGWSTSRWKNQLPHLITLEDASADHPVWEPADWQTFAEARRELIQEDLQRQDQWARITRGNTLGYLALSPFLGGLLMFGGWTLVRMRRDRTLGRAWPVDVRDHEVVLDGQRLDYRSLDLQDLERRLVGWIRSGRSGDFEGVMEATGDAQRAFAIQAQQASHHATMDEEVFVFDNPRASTRRAAQVLRPAVGALAVLVFGMTSMVYLTVPDTPFPFRCEDASCIERSYRHPGPGVRWLGAPVREPRSVEEWVRLHPPLLAGADPVETAPWYNAFLAARQHLQEEAEWRRAKWLWRVRAQGYSERHAPWWWGGLVFMSLLLLVEARLARRLAPKAVALQRHHLVFDGERLSLEGMKLEDIAGRIDLLLLGGHQGPDDLLLNRLSALLAAVELREEDPDSERDLRRLQQGCQHSA